MDSIGFHDLLRKAQGGDKAAMDGVLSILRPQLEPLASRYADPGRPSESTDDLLQQCCLRAWQKIGSFQGGESDAETLSMFRGWMAQILRRLGLNAERDRKIKRRSPPEGFVHASARGPGDSTTSAGGVDVPAGDSRPSEHARTNERRRRIEESLERVPDEGDAAIVRMHFFQGLTLPQIADRTGLNFAEIRRRYRAAMRVLEHDLKEWL